VARRLSSPPEQQQQQQPRRHHHRRPHRPRGGREGGAHALSDRAALLAEAVAPGSLLPLGEGDLHQFLAAAKLGRYQDSLEELLGAATVSDLYELDDGDMQEVGLKKLEKRRLGRYLEEQRWVHPIPTGAGGDHGIDHNKNWLRFPYVFISSRSTRTMPTPHGHLTALTVCMWHPRCARCALQAALPSADSGGVSRPFPSWNFRRNMAIGPY
jgi:hypothetical protein